MWISCSQGKIWSGQMACMQSARRTIPLWFLLVCLFLNPEKGLTFEVYQPSFSSLKFSRENKKEIFDVADLKGITDKKVAGLEVEVELQGDKVIPPEILKEIQSLKLLGAGQKVSDYLVRLAPQCPQLIHLHVRLKGGNLSEESLSILAKSSRLQSLILYAPSVPLSTNIYGLESLEELLVLKMDDCLIPKGISKLQQLKRLMIFRPTKIQLPEDLSQCKKLEVLDLAACPVGNRLFDYLPPNLIALTAFRCELTELAFKKNTLHKTRYLSLGDNSFKSIPQSLFAHGNLEIAMFDYNKIKIERLDFPPNGLEKIELLSFQAMELGALSERAEELRKKGILLTGD
jgi:hypothetical protein